MVAATFRFHDELNDFLPSEQRDREFAVRCACNATAKHMIEALGVPHTEVELILVNGASVGFDRLLRDGDRVAVYPRFDSLDIGPLLRLREWPLRVFRFVADSHLGGLARLLRMAGFDTLYRNNYRDSEIADIASHDRRIVLTRDRDLLKQRGISHGCYVHALKPARQFGEIVARLDLARSFRPFTLCLECNSPVRPIEKQSIFRKLPPSVNVRHEHFTICDHCGRVFWEGSHWQRMRQLLDTTIAQGGVSLDDR
jgi:uncharacterized protein